MKPKQAKRKAETLAYELKQRHMFDVELQAETIEEGLNISGAWSYALIDTLAGIIACGPDAQHKLNISAALLREKVYDHLEKLENA